MDCLSYIYHRQPYKGGNIPFFIHQKGQDHLPAFQLEVCLCHPGPLDIAPEQGFGQEPCI